MCVGVGQLTDTAYQWTTLSTRCQRKEALTEKRNKMNTQENEHRLPEAVVPAEHEQAYWEALLMQDAPPLQTEGR